MNSAILIDRYKKIRLSYFTWSRSLSAYKKLFLAAGMACLLGLSAQIKIALPWTPVPFTMQTFVVLLTGVLFGPSLALFSIMLYLISGMYLIPWFSGWNGGWLYMAGYTGGYLLGFIPAAFFTVDRIGIIAPQT